MLQKLNRLWFSLVGDPLLFPLESRIFHSVAVIVIVNALLILLPVSFLTGLYLTGGVILLAALTVVYLYYRSRFKGKMYSSVVAFGIIANLFVIYDFFYDSGISGPADMLMALTLLLIAAITVYRQQGRWLLLNVLVYLALHVIAWFYPQSIHHPVKTQLADYADQATAYLVTVVLFYFTIKYVRGNYELEKSRAEEKTRALEHLNAEKTKLMSIISHDLRAPLGSVQNFLELVADGDLDPAQRSALEEQLLRATQSTLSMLSTLLTWSKSQMEGIVVNLQRVNLLAVFKDTLELQRLIALKKEIVLTYHFDPQLAVIADPDMLQLVLRNLVGNAIKFTPFGGRIEVSAEMAGIECKVTVKDNGKGIAYAQQPGIFSLKAESTFGTNNEKGVGLGLLLCKEFIERQGGRISFESTPGQGSSFFILMAAETGERQHAIADLNA